MNQSIISKAIHSFEQGNIIALPTDTIYGLAVDATNAKAVKKLSFLKNRPSEKSYVIQVNSLKKLHNITENLNDKTINILNSYWPGAITFILNKSKNCNISFLNKTVAVRIPNLKITLDILDNFQKPIAVTSLNVSGEPVITSYKDISPNMMQLIDYLVPFSKRLSGLASTVVDLTQNPPKTIRQGSIIFE